MPGAGRLLPALYHIRPRGVDAPASGPYPATMAVGLPLGLSIVIATVIGMEALAWAVHRHVMHGWGWRWHRSHHEPRHCLFEKNDLYALVFAGISLLFFTLLARLWAPFWWVGAAMLVYGFLYTILHDGLVHGRLGFRAKPGNAYLKRLVQAHRLHHAVRDREGAVSFGFLYAPPVRNLRHQLRRQKAGSSSRRKPGSMNTDRAGSAPGVFMDPGSSPG